MVNNGLIQSMPEVFMPPPSSPIAHVRQDPATGSWHEHPLAEHLEGTAARAEAFVAVFGNGDWAKVGVLWHDLGRYW